MSIKDLQERKNVADGHIKGLLALFDEQGRSWKDEEQRAAFKKANEDYAAINADLKRAVDEAAEVDAARKAIEDNESRSVNHGKVIPGREDSAHSKPLGSGEERSASGTFNESDYNLALSGWLRGGKWASEEERSAMQKCGVKFSDQEPCISAREHAALSVERRQFAPQHVENRAMTSQTGATGGYTIEASTLNRQLEINMLAYGGMRQVAEMINTSSGEPFLWPTFDDTGNVGAILAENTTVGSSVEPTLTQITWNAYKFSSTPILVPYELLQDSFVDLNQVLGNALGERIGRKTNTYYTTGTGSSQPKGIVTAAGAGNTATNATSIVFADLMALVHAVDPAYRPGASFMMHDGILLAIRQLKDSQNRPLYVSGLVDGMPDKLLGFDVTINQDMQATVATATKTVLFGRMSNYKIRRVGGPRLYRLEERYRDTDQTGFIAFVREDGNLLKSATAPVKYMVQA